MVIRMVVLWKQVLNVLQLLLRRWNLQSAEVEEPDCKAAERCFFCGNHWEVTARSKSWRNYWICRCTWILDTSNGRPQVQTVCGRSLARGVKALPLEVVRGDSVLASRAPWHLRLLPQETNWKLCLTVLKVRARSNAAALNDLMARNSLCIFMKLLSIVHFWIFVLNKYFVRGQS